ncbi:KilA-N domain-containing protein [Tenacibaculum finnmarkense]|uniref:KilA-N domain-containing protein n=1 Tax=Tenacibaculum finnmarkense TaxID=2781243 RepID=UPI00207B064A|nr:KilA-N domain-containing protein [Tenacibaculum finnmarkense]MCM8906812.1 KilA-N domain-containing protein [Tenacibaculum finnmarkense genomovar finnmarkense]
MKTNVVMTRKMGDFDVNQRTKDGYFDGNLILSQWNSTKGNTRRRLDDFLSSKKTKEFLQVLEDDISHGEKSPRAFYDVKGRNTAKGRTTDKVWMHPFLFIKFAMWINPLFELKVIKFVYDDLINYRNIAGDNYKVLSSAGKKLKGYNYSKVATAIQWIVFDKTGKDLRQTANQKQLQEIYSLEQKFAFAIDMGYVKTYKDLIAGLREAYREKNGLPF